MLAYIEAKSKELEVQLIARRRDLHKYAELGWTEFRTAAMAIVELRKLGYNIKLGAAVVDQSAMMGVPPAVELKRQQERAIAQGADPELVQLMTGGMTGFIAEMNFAHAGSVMGFRVDMDANDINEAQNSEHRPCREGFASVNTGAMHACGHDAHVAVGLAVAEVIASMADRLTGSIRFIFQPAEEGLRGARPMVVAGVTKGLDYIIGMHIGFQADKKGALVCGARGFLASTKWDVTITGLNAHAGAAPQEGHNALLAGAVAAINLHAISRHGDGVTRINVGKMIAGEGRNVVPSSAVLVMETRGATSELNNYMTSEASRIIKAACDMYQCAHSIAVAGGTQSGESSEAMVNIIYEAAKDLPEYTDITKIKDFGAGEDFAHMLSEVQQDGGIGTYVQVGVTRTAGHHNSQFDIDEADLLPATKLMSYVIWKVLGA